MALAIVTLPDPLRLIAIFLVVSRPRPAQNMFAYWVGAFTFNFLVLAVPLTVLHFIPGFRSLVESFAGSPTASTSAVQPMPLALGVLLLVIAAAMTMRFRMRQPVPPAKPEAEDSILIEEPDTSTAFSRLRDRARNALSEGKSPFWRLLGRLINSWKNGSLWISLLMGLTYSPPQVSLALALLVASGAALGTQLAISVVFVLVMLAVVEIVLICSLVVPSRTHAAVQRLYEWALAYRKQVTIGICALGGALLVAIGANVL